MERESSSVDPLLIALIQGERTKMEDEEFIVRCKIINEIFVMKVPDISDGRIAIVGVQRFHI